MTPSGITLYGTSWCSDCKRAKQFFGEQRVGYDFVDVDADSNAMAYVEKVNDGKQIIPVIVFADGSTLVEPSNAELAAKLGLQTVAKRHFYDVIVVGSGPAGLTAALYAAREGLETLVIERAGVGGQAGVTERLDNFPGFPDGVTGAEFADRLRTQAQRFGVEILSAQEVTGLRSEGRYRCVTTGDGEDYRAGALLLALGSTYRRLGVPGEEDFIGAGVHFCATCDGAFYRGKQVLVVGGGNSAGEESVFLTRFADRVTIVTRDDALSASKVVQEKVAESSQIEVVTNASPSEFRGDSRLRSVVLRDVRTGDEREITPDGVFVFIGLSPNTDLVRGVVQLDDFGFIQTDIGLQTSLAGVFAAGDVRAGSTKQAASAAGEGAAVALSIRRYLESAMLGDEAAAQLPVQVGGRETVAQQPACVPSLSELVAALEQRYDPRTAESWDAVGLVCGDPAAPVRRVHFAVDPVAAVVDEAITTGAQLLVTHHPLFLGGTTTVAATTAKGRVVHRLIENGGALYVAHTNADVADPGVSDALAATVGLHDVAPIDPLPAEAQDKIVTFVPAGAVDVVLDAMSSAGAGVIGDYRRCAFLADGTGTFRAGPGTSPAVGAPGETTRTPEVRVEMVAPRSRRAVVVRALLASHPYEEPAFDVVELAAAAGRRGLGRIGELDRPTTLAEFTEHAARVLPWTAWGVRAAGDPQRPVRRVAVCGGSGGSLARAAAQSGADVLLTADLKHHVTSEAVEDEVIALVDAAHWATEWPWLAQAAALLAATATVETSVSTLVTDPWTAHAHRKDT